MLNLIFTLRGAKTSSLSRAVKAFEVRGWVWLVWTRQFQG